MEATFAQIAELQNQLDEANKKAAENEAAHDILGGLVQKGEVQVDHQGNAKVSKRNRNWP